MSRRWARCPGGGSRGERRPGQWAGGWMAVSGQAPLWQCGPLRPGVSLQADQAASQTQPDRVTPGRLLLSPDPLTALHCILEQVTPPSSSPAPQHVCFFPRAADTKPHRWGSLHSRYLFSQFEARSQDQSVGRAVTGHLSLPPASGGLRRSLAHVWPRRSPQVFPESEMRAL